MFSKEISHVEITLFKRVTKVIGSVSIFLMFQNIAASLKDSSLPVLMKALHIYSYIANQVM